MNKALKEIADKSDALMAERDAESARQTKNIEEAANELSEAEADKLAANDADKYAEAAERARMATDRLEFYKAARRNLDKPAMPRDEYDGAKGVIRSAAEEAAERFRESTGEIQRQLAKAYEAYAQEMDEINGVAVKLDKAARILQTEYGPLWNRETTRYGLPAQRSLYFARESNKVAADPVRYATWQLITAIEGWEVAGWN